MRGRTGLFVCLLALGPSFACSDDTEKKLAEALADHGVKDVKVDDKKIAAKCPAGPIVELDAALLERNFLGMVKAGKVADVGRALLKECDAKEEEKRRAERATIPASTGGAAPTPAAPPPTGAWTSEPGFLRLSSAAGDRLTYSCTGKAKSLYVQPAATPKKKTSSIAVDIDGASSKWKVRPSTDGKALFIVDTKGALKRMSAGESMTLTIPSKTTSTATFAIHGLVEALKALAPACRK